MLDAVMGSLNNSPDFPLVCFSGCAKAGELKIVICPILLNMHTHKT